VPPWPNIRTLCPNTYLCWTSTIQQTFFHGSVISFHHSVGTLGCCYPASEWNVQGRTQVKYLIGRSFSQMNGYVPCGIYSI
jgi:hypothetical protein